MRLVPLLLVAAFSLRATPSPCSPASRFEPGGAPHDRGKLEVLAPAPAAVASDDLRLESTALSVVLDPFGGFGQATSGRDAVFEGAGGAAGTLFEAALHVRGIGLLHSRALLLPGAVAGARREDDAIVASYALGAFRFDVRTTLPPSGAGAALLEQVVDVTNESADAAPLLVTAYVDADLAGSGASDDDLPLRDGPALVVLDDASGAPDVTRLELTTEAPAAVRVVREIGQFDEQRRRILRGGALVDGTVRGELGVAEPASVGFDASLAAAHDFGALPPGGSVRLVVRLAWGMGRATWPRALVEPRRIVECEGREGTVVLLEGDATEPEAVRRWEWVVDGAVLPEGRDAEVVLAPGGHDLLLRVTDVGGRASEASGTATVVDTSAPAVHVGAPALLWPPDRRWVAVSPPVATRDACAREVGIRALAVSCDEPGPSAFIDAEGRAWLRRERSGSGDGRTYTVLAEATDEAGNATTFTWSAVVPHDAREGRTRLVAAVVPRRPLAGP